jgi:prevent-host-death family protein
MSQIRNPFSDEASMPRTVTASEAKNQLGSIVGWVLENQDEVIIKSHGEPKAVIMSFDEYEKMQMLKEQARRKEALERLRTLRESVRERNQDLTEEQAMEIADRFTREVIDEMAAEGKIKFERGT